MAIIIINADDAGLHPAMDNGIQQCIDAHIVNSVSVITNSPLVKFEVIKKWSEMGVQTGVHLSWVGVPWLTQSYFFFDWKFFLLAYVFKGKHFREEVYEEGKAQIAQMVKNNIPVTHLDSHQHVHHFPFLWRTCMQLIAEFNIPRIRCAKAFDFSFTRKNLAGLILQFFASSKFENGMLACGGLKYSGNYSAQQIIAELKATSDKNIEFIVHPGTDNAELNKLYKHWKFDWEKETKALLSSEFRELLNTI